jgi:hypothetical protein
MILKQPIPLLLAVLGCAACATGEAGSSQANPGSDGASDSGDARPAARAEPSAAAQPEATPADPFVQGFVDAHNLARARVSPAASPALADVQWSPELATTAAAWASRCKFEHSRTDYGENLAARTENADPATIVGDWVAEAANYDHRRKRCASGEVCGHYTQVAWRSTHSIGCGVARCDGGGPFGGGVWFMWVCNYDPPGNWQGEGPY